MPLLVLSSGKRLCRNSLLPPMAEPGKLMRRSSEVVCRGDDATSSCAGAAADPLAKNAEIDILVAMEIAFVKAASGAKRAGMN